MTDKFAEYYSKQDRIESLSEYVHLNFQLIQTKMISEMRRELDINPDSTNSEGYISLMVSLYGRMVNEVIYSLHALCQGLSLRVVDIIPPATFLILFDLIEGKNFLQGRTRDDIPNDKEKFLKYYQKHIESLRSIVEAIPKVSK